MVEKFNLNDVTISPGKRARLYDLLYNHGPKNGSLMILPIDQGLEHGPIDFLDNPPAEHPFFQFELAVQGKFSAIACHIGLAQKYYTAYAGKIPLVLKLNGRTDIPSNDNAFSACDASVEDAIKLGASAVGYTLFVGSPRQDDDIKQLTEVRKDCDRYGMPLIVWAYPRGSAVDNKGGIDTLYAVDYAAREAQELGADIVKVNFPQPVNKLCPEKYQMTKDWDLGKRIEKVVSSAGRSILIFSGGSKVSEEELMHRIDESLKNGGRGVIFGRNLWQRPFDEAIALAQKIQERLTKYNL
ncbi:MAG: class I fructose-bisphosphate aldolase [Candidatus Woesearchaeota archaeon]